MRRTHEEHEMIPSVELYDAGFSTELEERDDDIPTLSLISGEQDATYDDGEFLIDKKPVTRAALDRVYTTPPGELKLAESITDQPPRGAMWGRSRRVNFCDFRMSNEDSEWFDQGVDKVMPIWGNDRISSIRDGSPYLYTMAGFGILLWIFTTVFGALGVTETDSCVGCQIAYVVFVAIYVITVPVFEMSQVDIRLAKLLVKTFEFWFVMFAVILNCTILVDRFARHGVGGIHNLGALLLFLIVVIWFLLWDANPQFHGRSRRKFKMAFLVVVIGILGLVHFFSVVLEDKSSEFCFNIFHEHCFTIQSAFASPGRFNLLVFFVKYLVSVGWYEERMLILNTSVDLKLNVRPYTSPIESANVGAAGGGSCDEKEVPVGAIGDYSDE